MIEVRDVVGHRCELNFFLLLKQIHAISIRNHRDVWITIGLQNTDRLGARSTLGFAIAGTAEKITGKVPHDPMTHRRIFSRRNRVRPRSIGVPIEVQHHQGIEFSGIGSLPPHDRSSRYVRLQKKISADGHTDGSCRAVEASQSQKTLYLDDAGLRWERQWIVAGPGSSGKKFSGASLDRGEPSR